MSFCLSCPCSFPWSSSCWSALVLHLIITLQDVVLFQLQFDIPSRFVVLPQVSYILVNDSAALQNAFNQIRLLFSWTSSLNYGIAVINHFKIHSQVVNSEAGCVSVGKEGAFFFLLEVCVEFCLLLQAILAWVLPSLSQGQ